MPPSLATRTPSAASRDLAARADGAVLLTAREIEGQLGELAAAGFALSLVEPPARCGSCNGGLDRLADDDARPAYAPDDAPATFLPFGIGTRETFGGTVLVGATSLLGHWV